jgi:hypothetical protein
MDVATPADCPDQTPKPIVATSTTGLVRPCPGRRLRREHTDQSSADHGRRITDTLYDHSPLFGSAATPGAIVVYTRATAVADNRVVGLR